MKGSRFTAEQIVAALKEAEARIAVKELCRNYEIGDRTLWKYGGVQGDTDLMHEI